MTWVGGTSLRRAPSTTRGWTETAWDLTGSGCADFWAKPSWQTLDDSEPAGCLDRTDNDVAAVGDTEHRGLDLRQHLHRRPAGRLAAGRRHQRGRPDHRRGVRAGRIPGPGTYPASYLYLPGRASHLNDVTSGGNGACGSRPGVPVPRPGPVMTPHGLGTPDGTAAFAPPAGDTVTVTDPGVQDAAAGRAFTLPVKALGSAPGDQLAYAAAGCPGPVTQPGHRRHHREAARHGRHLDRHGHRHRPAPARATVSFRLVVVPSLRAAHHKVTGPVTVDPGLGPLCLDDRGDSTRDGTPALLSTCHPRTAAQQWTYLPDAAPDSTGTLAIRGKCLAIAGNATRNGSKLVLEPCDGAPGEEWTLQAEANRRVNPASGRCLNDPDFSERSGTQADLADCDSAPIRTWCPPGRTGAVRARRRLRHRSRQ